ncbi:hypothetical protein ED733_001074 [Metarhizium rileyi]|uniref:BZIP transcription factor, bZIP-1 n=1 Tax=Metarhizium rileyi (strain RCEF 4871) TaxID=1649241 RepID=A0A5C6FZL5_METRR|nr:hypothetical protein ED733_001074 [Metarhizium rileyi]
MNKDDGWTQVGVVSGESANYTSSTSANHHQHLHHLTAGTETETEIGMDIGNNDLMSILSARKYPLPATHHHVTNTSAWDLPQPSSFIFGPNDGTRDPFNLCGASAEGLNYLMSGFEQFSAPNAQITSAPSPTGRINAPSKKRAGGDDGGVSKEKRKKQIRDAQRTYRMRKESRLSSLTHRIFELEQVIDDMSTTIATFSDCLLQSGVLAPHVNLTQRTRETLEECLRLARTTSLDEGQGDPSANQVEKPPPEKKEPSSTIVNMRRPPRPGESPMRPLFAHSQMVLPLQYSAFMDQLHMTILYRGYLLLTDPSASVEVVRQRFRLLFPILGRGNLTAYFAAALHAKISKADVANQWQSIPFFQLGGAGTHYAWPPELGPYTRRSRHWHAVSVPLSHFSSDIQSDLRGDWFDMQDLECFLMEKNIQFTTSTNALGSPEISARQGKLHVNARELIAGMTPWI